LLHLSHPTCNGFACLFWMPLRLPLDCLSLICSANLADKNVQSNKIVPNYTTIQTKSCQNLYPTCKSCLTRTTFFIGNQSLGPRLRAQNFVVQIYNWITSKIVKSSNNVPFSAPDFVITERQQLKSLKAHSSLVFIAESTYQKNFPTRLLNPREQR
jgi:hypothetical protein